MRDNITYNTVCCLRIIDVLYVLLFECEKCIIMRETCGIKMQNNALQMHNDAQKYNTHRIINAVFKAIMHYNMMHNACNTTKMHV